MGDTIKPPLGIKPRWLHNEHRAKEIKKAMERYTKEKYSIPEDWIEEYNDLRKQIEQHNIKYNIDQ